MATRLVLASKKSTIYSIICKRRRDKCLNIAGRTPTMGCWRTVKFFETIPALNIGSLNFVQVSGDCATSQCKKIGRFLQQTFSFVRSVFYSDTTRMQRQTHCCCKMAYKNVRRTTLKNISMVISKTNCSDFHT